MKKIIKYIAVDGTEFSNRAKCVDYENKLVYSGDISELLNKFRCFVRNNKDLYDKYFTVHHLNNITIERRENKKAFAVTGVWYGSYGYVSEPTTYLIPDLLISNPDAYREERKRKLEDDLKKTYIGGGI